jgi:hypothetical protein
MGTGENIDGMSQLSQFTAKFSDVYAHATGTFSPQPPKGTTVNTEHGYLQFHGCFQTPYSGFLGPPL